MSCTVQDSYVPCGCKAILRENDPRAGIWKKIFGCLEFPLKNPVSTEGAARGEGSARFLMGDWAALSWDQKVIMKTEMKKRFNASSFEFDEQIRILGFVPIKDVNISIKICNLHFRCML